MTAFEHNVSMSRATFSSLQAVQVKNACHPFWPLDVLAVLSPSTACSIQIAFLITNFTHEYNSQDNYCCNLRRLCLRQLMQEKRMNPWYQPYVNRQAARSVPCSDDAISSLEIMASNTLRSLSPFSFPSCHHNPILKQA